MLIAPADDASRDHTWSIAAWSSLHLLASSARLSGSSYEV